MKIHDDLATAAFDFPPVAAATGPFPGREFLSTWWHHRPYGELLLVEGENALVPLLRTEAVVEFAGEADLTDYHSPRGDVAAVTVAVEEAARLLGPAAAWRADSLPEEGARVVAAGLEAAGRAPRVEVHEVAAVVALEGDFSRYLDALGKKDRHELRRKRRRFTADLGEPTLASGREFFDVFVALHRQSVGRKGSFMTEEMKAFFAGLSAIDTSRIDVLLTGAGDPVAAAFGFVDDDAYYLYNSGYDSAVGSSSPGQVMLGMLIERSIGERRRRFDFLKGGEEYKFRLGARPRPLYVVSA